MRAPSLVGRVAEVGAVGRAVAAASQGRGSCLLVTGEAGIGKSRLLAEGSALARAAGMVVLSGRAVEDGGPFRPVAQALLGHLRDSSVAESDELRPFRAALGRLIPGWSAPDAAAGVDPVVVLGEGVLRLLRGVGGDAGSVLVLEDLHWADTDSLALVEYLAGAVDGSRTLLLLSARSDEAAPAALGRLPGAETVHLRRLGREDVTRLAVGCAGGPLPADVTAFLETHAEGLPFLVEELLSGLVESGAVRVDGAAWVVRDELGARQSPTLADLVRRRLGAFPPRLRPVLDAAAMVGRDVDWTLLAPVADLPEDDVIEGLRAAVRLHLLERDPGAADGFRWRHALVRESVLAELLPPEQRRVARRAAAAIEDRDPGLTGPDAALAAELHARGGRPERAAQVLLRIAERSVAGGALRTADEALERASALGGAAEVAVARVRVLCLRGLAHEAIEVGTAALPAASGRHHVELCLGLARAAVAVRAWDEATAYLTAAGARDDPRVLALAADVAFGADRVGDAAQLASRAVDAAHERGWPETECEALAAVARCARLSDPGAATEALRRAADVASAHGLTPWRIRALFGLATLQLMVDDDTTGVEEARELALDAGMLADAAGMGLLVADSRMVTGGPVAALPMALETGELAAGLGLRMVQAGATGLAAWAHAAADRPADMAAAIDDVRRIAPDWTDGVAGATAAAALDAVLAHDLAGARDRLDASVRMVRGQRNAAPLPYFGLWALVRTVLGDRDEEARTELRSSEMSVRAVGRAGLTYADAVAAGRRGGSQDAARLFAAAGDMVATQHWWRRLLRLVALEAAVADGWGDPVAELRVDVAAFDAGGDVRMARIARDLLRRAGAPVPRRGRGDTAVPAALRALGVTTREMDVLALVSEGLTNAQIAERLFLSRRTVETHVTSLLGKTGTTRRSDLSPYGRAVTP